MPNPTPPNLQKNQEIPDFMEIWAKAFFLLITWKSHVARAFICDFDVMRRKKKKSWKRPEPDRMGGAGLESFFSFRKPFFLQTPFSFSRAPFFLQTPFSPRHPFFLQTPFFPPIWNFPAWIFSFVKLVISNLEISNLKISSLGLRVYITLGFFQNINITLRFF